MPKKNFQLYRPKHDQARAKIKSSTEFRDIIKQENSKIPTDPQNTSYSRRSRKLRDHKNRRKYGKNHKREQILFESLEGTERLSSEIQTSLAIIKQAKAQNEKYAMNRSKSRRNSEATKPQKKESYTQKYKRSRGETFNNQSEFSQTMKFPKGTLMGRHSSTSGFDQEPQMRERVDSYNEPTSPIRERDRSYSQYRNSAQKPALEASKTEKWLKIPSASPASNFQSAREKATAHKTYINRKKGKYRQKPIHKILDNFMDDDEEDEEAIMKMLNDRKQELFHVRQTQQEGISEFKHNEYQIPQRENFRVREQNPASHRVKSPKSSKLSKEEIHRIRLQAAEAERKYKVKQDAAKRIQRWWRRNKEKLINKFEYKAKQALQEATQSMENLDTIDDVIIEADSIRIPIVQNEAPGRQFLNNYETVQKTVYEPQLSTTQKQRVLALFLGWKTRRILKNQHLRDLKSEIGYMIKLKRDDLSDEQLKHWNKEFWRISRKFCDIFNRLWTTKAWIKNYNTNRGRSSSHSREQYTRIKSPAARNFNPVFEATKQFAPEPEPEREMEVDRVEKVETIPKPERQQVRRKERDGREGRDVREGRHPQRKEKIQDDTSIRQTRKNTFLELPPSSRTQNRDLSTPSLRLQNTLTAPTQPIPEEVDFTSEVAKPLQKSTSMYIGAGQMNFTPQMYSPYPQYPQYPVAVNYQPQVVAQPVPVGAQPVAPQQVQPQVVPPQGVQPVYQYQVPQGQPPLQNPVYIVYPQQQVVPEQVPKEPETHRPTSGFQLEPAPFLDLKEAKIEERKEAPILSPKDTKSGYNSVKNVTKKKSRTKEELSFMDTFPSQSRTKTSNEIGKIFP